MFKTLMTHLFLFVFLMTGFAYGGEIKIYDTGKIEDKKYFSEKFGENVHAKYLKYAGKIKKRSVLRDSEARIIKPDKKLIAAVVDWVTEAKDSDYKYHINGHSNITEIVKINSIEKPACVEINAVSDKIIIFSGTFNGEIKKDRDFKKESKPLNLLWIGKYDRDEITETIFADLSISSDYDNKADISVEAIADIDNDGVHEVIVNDTRYAGYSYEIINFTYDGYFIKSIHADSWD